ncbi:MAG: S1/P1 Nuclease [Caulobacter sp.]|nr:S1/P1 Nuclease [Caulobacter sp.]
MRPAFRFAALAAAVGLALTPAAASSWGNTGHRIIGVLAVEALPEEVPAFLRGKKAMQDMGELAREPDRSKGAGRIHDSNRDPAHFIDIDDEGRVLGGPVFADLASTRAEYETALRAAGTDSWKAGYLQFSIVDGYQQLVKDFAMWRVDVAGAKYGKGAQKAWFKRDRMRREALLIANLANLAHFVGDGSQPLHATTHYNGWGDYPNPKGYTTERIHGPFEGAFVKGAVTIDMARPTMKPFASCGCPVEKRAIAYLIRTQTFVEPLYALWKDGALRPGQTRGADFAAERIGAGATELRDLIVEAWRASANAKVGWPEVSVADVESGKVDAYEAMLGAD